MPNNSASIAVAENRIGEVESAGADADVMLASDAARRWRPVARGLAAGVRGFRLVLTPSQPLVAGDYTLAFELVGRSSAAAPHEVLRLTLPASPAASGAMFIRRGPTTGNRDVPTADLRFRRTEQLRVELPRQKGRRTARLLDRTGKPIAVPVDCRRS